MVAYAHGVALAVHRGGQAASTESCTHSAKRDHRFAPPIVERQRLPNVRICLLTKFQLNQSRGLSENEQKLLHQSEAKKW